MQKYAKQSKQRLSVHTKSTYVPPNPDTSNCWIFLFLIETKIEDEHLTTKLLNDLTLTMLIPDKI
jgi:hypothetical protein